MSHAPSSTTSKEDSFREKGLDVEEGLTGKEPSKAETASEAIHPWHPSQFPDGGKVAFLCLLGAFCCLFCSFGWLNCVGVFQSYYETHQLRDKSSSQIAWISSLQIFVMFFPGPIVGFLFDNHGPKYMIVAGTFFHVFGLMMTSLCKEYYQFILAQGICSPLGLNCIFNAAVSSLPTWFLKKRGLAYGVTAAGSGLGGVLFPIMASHLIPQIGFGWTMRTFAFIILGLMLIAFATVKSRLPPKTRAFKLHVFVDPFKDLRFTMMVIASFLYFLGLFIPINFIQVEAMANGMSVRLSSYLLSILNAASIFGRVIPGALADKFGPFNLQFVMSFLTGILCLALGLPASGNAAFIAFAVLYGFVSGAFVSLAPAQIAKISNVQEIGVRTGVLFSCVSISGLIGNPIAGTLVDGTGFDKVNIFAGVVMIAGGVLFVLTRMVVTGWKFAQIA
ncbi:MFS general substrate transporter [Bimuria novae-zelandiae CBS 107.79]|uniref:MFS general substrate transporter n=1 Tax=Bimuria novae-zelandiae CBS 107.79 TaxID=1447943 RepID=A0A6A5VI63_9PLEO|nr:MFS general substrate transporter [Bimuria novae-zelandiae CBS 107.79]